ncbi:hypothetical protein [Rhodococcus jostii]|uniref:hypothetical protein n=1 Tax=Rhodococcus jostii TaxID=132919 RepID=UPI0036290B94
MTRQYERARKRLEALERRAANAARTAAAHEQARRRNKRVALARERERQLLESEILERRRELREIEKLMMPDAYAGRDGRIRKARHETGAGTLKPGRSPMSRGQRPRTVTYFPRMKFRSSGRIGRRNKEWTSRFLAKWISSLRDLPASPAESELS